MAVTTRELLAHAPHDALQSLSGLGGLFDALQNSDMAVVVADVREPEQPIVFANEAFTALTGYGLAEILGRNCRFMQGPLTDNAAIRAMREAVAESRRVYIDVQNYRKDGALFWNRIALSPVADAGGAVTHYIALQCDVTLVHQAIATRDALRASDEAPEYSLLGSQLIGSWNWDVRHDRVYADERYAALYDVTAAQAARGASLANFLRNVHPEDRERAEQTARSAIESGEAYQDEYRVVTQGRVRWIALRGQCTYNDDGTPRSFSGVAWDISEYKRAEQALHESAEELRLITDALPALIGYVDAEQRFRFNNRAYLDWFGLPPQALYGKTVREVLGDHAYELRRKHLEDALVGIPAHFEAYAPHTDGTPHHALMQYLPRRMKDGRVSGCYVLVFDITERKRAEEATRLHGARMDALINQAAVGIVQVNMDARIVMVNQRFCEIAGRPEDTLVGQHVQQLVHAGDQAETRRLMLLLRTRGEPFFVEQRIVRPDGAIVWVSNHVSALKDASGQPEFASIIVSDVTARKQAEERQSALLELGDHLRDLTDADAIVSTAVAMLARMSGLSRVGYGQVDPTQQSAHIEDAWIAGRAQVSVAGDHRFEDYGQTTARLRNGETIAIPDVLRDPRSAEHAESLLSLGVRALVNVPLVEQGQLVGVLFLHHHLPRQWAASELDFVRNVADRIWAALKRASATVQLERLNATLEQRVAQRTADLDRMWRLSTDVMLATGFDMRILALNPAWKTALGWEPGDLVGASFLDLVHPDEQAATQAAVAQLSHGMPTLQFENRVRHQDGSYRWFAWRAAADEVGVHGVGRDVTSEKEAAEALRKAEDQLRQAHKMEAVGQLTGGIAHDFNNILQGVIGPLDLIRRSIKLGRVDNLGRFIDTATTAAKRAAALTHRLLAFSRRQSLDPRALDLNTLVTSLEELLRRTIGEGIVLEVSLAPDLWPAYTDANQLENALLNLVINARDAMPEGGGLAITTNNVTLDDAYVRRQDGMRAGDYVALSVTDTGVGMPPEVIAKAFDPFFTTKPIGQGTGLGLSMIYGFAKQSNGHVRIRSEVGVGTSVRLYLPRCVDPVQLSNAANELPLELPHIALDGSAPLVGGKTVLVVEDDAAVRMVVLDVLEGLGYRTVEACDGLEGLAVVQSDQRIDLMVTDVGMPKLNGHDLAEEARDLRPDLKILFMTGYAKNATLRSGFLRPGMEMIAKPFVLDALAAHVRSMLSDETDA
ncbi:PAS domain S-box protein [Pigmentiphaga litoralis]|uniref:histidine kinase n=1 Tax=Pigmentiphaga litoralis TaxID=516702 RepID=A0A7Y9J0B3_9BURK|nr:PAS domain S-box protein [Pigmentiphaga litoralis]NYE27069.1 PAS domain S-box-containing protein [Pigmentiphaga litoralis]NYE86185.1 PAS domain S-box-containing protein [Pigmentiphaga litoralis]